MSSVGPSVLGDSAGSDSEPQAEGTRSWPTAGPLRADVSDVKRCPGEWHILTPQHQG